MFAPDEIIDLTHPIDESIPLWPTFPRLTLEQTQWAARDGVTMDTVEMRTHTATHVDAPLHFIAEGKTLDDFSIEKFMGPGVVIDITPKEPEEAITPDDIQPYEDVIEANDILLLHTGWDQYYGRTPEYLFEFPYLTGETAEYLADLDLKAVGTEGASVGGWTEEVANHGPATDVPPDASHLPLLQNDILAIEELRNLDRVLDGEAHRRAYVFYPPLNFQNTSGSSVRAFAFL
jgi:kynurenine formamidase